MKKTYTFILMMLITMTAAAAGWDAELRSVTEWDDDDERVAAIQPQVRYKGDGWKAHVEYWIPFDPEAEDGEIEQEIEYKMPVIKGLALKNETYYDVENGEWAAELTPKWYTKVWGIKAGFELEIDYLKNDEFDLYEIEIEPTVKKSWAVGEKSELELELEMPVTRLYSSSKDDVDVEELAVLAIYDYAVTDDTAIEVRGELHCDVQDGECEKILEVALKHDF